MSTVLTEVTDKRCVTQTVVESIAEAEGTDPLELTPPLYDVIDPDALENLFIGSQTLGKIIFNYNNLEISVFSDGYISVEKKAYK